MQPTDNFSVPRRALDVEDFIDILRRHKGWIFGPFLLTLVASVVGVYLWPDSYESSAKVKIVPQQVSQNLVQSSLTNDVSDRINSMAATVLSRSVLTTIINTLDLYKSERNRLPMEDVVENVMRKDIHIIPMMANSDGRSIPGFIVQFSYPDRMAANRVVQEIVSKFISENTTTRSNASTENLQFFKEQAEQAKKELEDMENRLAAYKAQNNGRLPEQVDLNYRNLQTLQTNYQNLTNSKSRAEMENLTAQTNLDIERAHKAELSELTKEAAQTAPLTTPESERMIEAEHDIRTLDEALTVLRQRYTDKNPEVQTAKTRLEAAKQRKADLQKEEAEAKTPVAAAGGNRQLQLQLQLQDVDGNIQRYQTAIRSRELEIEGYNKQIKETQSQIDKLNAQIGATPLGEQQYGDLVRERDIAKAKYVDIDARMSKAQISNDLERGGQSERLEVLDPASLPQYPTEPKRPMVIGAGAALGLLFGVIIAAAREMKDTSLKNLKDVRAYTQLAILGSVPLLENDFVVRRRKRIAWLGWTTACLVAAVTMAGTIVFYYYKQSV